MRKIKTYPIGKYDDAVSNLTVYCLNNGFQGVTFGDHRGRWFRYTYNWSKPTTVPRFMIGRGSFSDGMRKQIYDVFDCTMEEALNYIDIISGQCKA